MQTKTVVLKDFNIPLFKTLVSRSLMTVTSINLTITPDIIESKATAKADSLVKNWSSSTSKLFTSSSFDPIYFSVHNGAFFNNQILSLFDDTCDISLNINTIDNSVVDIVISNNTMKISAKGSPLNLNFEKLEDAEKETYFNIDNANSTFVLTGENIEKVIRLCKINKNSESPVNYVQFEGVDGRLIVKDTSFELAIGEFSGENFIARVHKELLSQIEQEDQSVAFIKSDNSPVDKFVLTSLNENINSNILIVLMVDMQTATADDAFYKDEIDFSESDGGW